MGIDPDEAGVGVRTEGTRHGPHREGVVSTERDGQLALGGMLVHPLGNHLRHLGHEPGLLEHPDVRVLDALSEREGRWGEGVESSEVDLPSESLHTISSAVFSRVDRAA